MIPINKISIVLADDHPIVLQGLRTLLSAEPNFTVVGEAMNGRDAINLVEDLQPDVLVLDWMMPDLTGIEVTRKLSNTQTQTKIIIHSMYASEIYVMDALRAGAIGYVPKDSSEEILIRAINQAAAGEIYLAPPLSKRAMELYVAKARGQKPEIREETPFQNLTPREREIFQLILENYTSDQIASRLSISPRTVHSHRANMMRKLGIKNRAELYSFAVNNSLLPNNNNND